MRTVELPVELAEDAYRTNYLPYVVPFNGDRSYLTVPHRDAHFAVRLAMTDPKRLHPETLTVDVPITWLIGERVGY